MLTWIKRIIFLIGLYVVLLKLGLWDLLLNVVFGIPNIIGMLIS